MSGQRNDHDEIQRQPYGDHARAVQVLQLADDGKRSGVYADNDGREQGWRCNTR